MLGILKLKSVYDSVNLRYKQAFIEEMSLAGVKGAYMKEYEELKSIYRTGNDISEFVIAESIKSMFKPFVNTIKDAIAHLKDYSNLSHGKNLAAESKNMANSIIKGEGFILMQSMYVNLK
eukprot:TRINITY_DN16146_c0_g2_i2.p3 TRINITY_DN16146_c0_g2~~TRINITY_DN16146_c0_g2_i2.p3  ORF type:complete len:120 (+),score=5.92 TRINITY_DN16146_c0_g2_i2:528-887(+)